MVDNTTVLQACYLAGSTDFQQRVPDPSQHSVAQVQKFLFQPMNKKYRNEFIDLLFNVFAVQMVHQRMYRNPLKKKRADIDYGTTVQEIALDFCKAHSYKDDWGHRPEDITNLLKVYRPTGEVAYHSVNRYDQYPISINDMELRGAFQTPTGLNALVNAVMNVPYNSGEYDEYQYYKQIIAEHEYYHGFYKHHMDARPNDETTGKEFLRALRMYADLITVPTKLYNATDANVPVWINEDERASMVLYLEADVKATLDVDTLSSVFHLDKAESPYRIQFIDSIPIPGAFALLTTEDFWMCADYDVSTEDFRNPQTKTTTYYYTVIGMYSASPFVPAILFTTAEGTTPQVVQRPASRAEVRSRWSLRSPAPLRRAWARWEACSRWRPIRSPTRSLPRPQRGKARRKASPCSSTWTHTWTASASSTSVARCPWARRSPSRSRPPTSTPAGRPRNTTRRPPLPSRSSGIIAHGAPIDHKPHI